MIKKIVKHQRVLLAALVVICMGIIAGGAVHYLEKLQNNLKEDAIQDVINVIIQQQQAFDNFIIGDQEQLHNIAEHFTDNNYDSLEQAQQVMALFEETDSTYTVMCFDEGWSCSSTYSDVLWLDEETLDSYRGITGSGVRDNYIGLRSGVPQFCYYETFTFRNGHKGMVEKSYARSKVSERFSLSFYDGQGYGYILNQEGDILLRSVSMTSDYVYENVFDALAATLNHPEDIEAFRTSLRAEETGCITFEGKGGRFVYTYVPVESVDGWYLLSIVPEDAIRAEADQMLQDTKTTLLVLVLILIICAVLILLIWRTHKDIAAKDWEVSYQSQLFDVFTTFFSSNIDDMYIMLDHETEEIEYISPNVERVLGVKAENAFDFIRGSDMEADSEATKDYYAKVNALTPDDPAIVRNTERINPRTGEHMYFEESVFCTDIQGQRKRVAYISDRTKDRKVQNSLAETLRMAQAANDAKSAFLGNVSHDIRTPMNAIIGFLALLQDEADNPKMVIEYAQRIDAASQHLLSLINDVLDMNKIESGSAMLNISELNVAEVIEEINTIIRPQARNKNQNFDIFAAHLTHEHLIGDKLRINQILINLLSNAVKYTPENGAIRLQIEELPQVVNDYGRIRFTISDNGVGMSKEYLKVIFEPFTREQTTVIREIQGTGLGMAITKSLVDMMGGTIRVESEVGKGSTFIVELELHIQELEDDPTFWNTHSVKRMIVADDDEETCRSIVKTMSGSGVVTDYATDGATAVRRMREARETGHPYDLILLDWKMPDLDGLQTARLIRKNYSNKIPILLLTAYDWSEIEHEAREIGVDHFMPKPFFMSTFKEAIRRVMGTRKKETDNSSDIVRGKRILVVDDIEANRIILVKILGALGAACDTAGNGKEAVELFETSRAGDYDLILMDVQMPVMDGYTATRKIRSSVHPSAGTIPIIAMTANAFVDDVRDAMASGMDAHISKPVQLGTLKTTIQRVMENQKEEKTEAAGAGVFTDSIKG